MERLDAVEQRLKQISDLRRKYGRTVEDVLAFLSDAEAKLNELINAEAFIAEIDAKLEKIKAEYDKQADKLSDIRQKAAERLKNAVL